MYSQPLDNYHGLSAIRIAVVLFRVESLSVLRLLCKHSSYQPRGKQEFLQGTSPTLI